MCFSANASFGISAVLIAGGVVATKKTNEKSLLPFAAIPLIFGIQQFIEGILWLSLTHSEYAHLQNSATHTFIFIAQVLWPTWVPFAMWKMEQNEKRKEYILKILYLGIAVSAFLLYCLITYKVGAEVSNHHIHYELEYPADRAYTGIFYFIPTVIPAIISTTKKMWVMGLINLLSFVVTKFYFGEYVVSVWCYFAAALSILVLWVIFKKEENKIIETQ